MFQLVRRHRPVEVIALDFVASVATKKIHLRLGLDALGNNPKAQVAGQIDNGQRYGAVLFVFLKSL